MHPCSARSRRPDLNTGEWSKQSRKEAKKYCPVDAAASAEASNVTCAPKQAERKLDPNAACVHLCSSETIGDGEDHRTPDTGTLPLVADVVSSIMPHPVDVSRSLPRAW